MAKMAILSIIWPKWPFCLSGVNKSAFFRNHQPFIPKLDGHGRPRREAARRRKSECNINFRKTKIPLAVMAGRMKKFTVKILPLFRKLWTLAR